MFHYFLESSNRFTFLEEFYSIMSHREARGAHTTDMYIHNKDAVMPTEQNQREVSQVINTCFIY